MANSITILPLIFCFLFPLATCSSNKTDLLSLLAFKSAIDLDPQGALNSWNETVPFCSWKGIQCSRRHRDRVVEINLMSQGLVGSLSPHIGNLSFLRTIILQNNNLHGQIPQEIGLLKRLAYVEFTNNSFIGAIPKNLSLCPNLVYLNLTDNELSGAIPTELGSMSKLEVLGLAFNKLSGPIPPSIGNITSLKRFSLRFGNFTGEIPKSLAQLQSLTFLQLTENNLTGTIPLGLFNMSELQFFAVSFNKFHGVLPSTIGLTLPNLKRIYLWGNRFSGPIPFSFSNASLLEHLVLSFNSFTGPMPRLGSLSHLQSFLSESNLIVDDVSFISSLTNSTKLEVLRVGDNKFTGSLPVSVTNLTGHLRRLHLDRNKIHGNIPSSLGNLINLTALFLNENYLEGPIPDGVAKLANLQELNVGANRFTSELPSSLGNLTSLNLLYLNENNFLGNLPSSIGNCTFLRALDLSHNNFNGLIPQEIMSLSSVSIMFNLSYNYFGGSIPYQVGSLTNVEALDLSNNRLSGPIPNSLSKCMSLQQLYLEGNLLEGEIPPGLSALMGLLDLDLSRNNLSGSIPSFLAKLNLEKLNLSFNRLQGEVPTLGAVFKNKTSISLDGNKELCGGIPELKLPPCASVKSPKKKFSHLLKILLPVFAAGGICLMLLVFFTFKPRKSKTNETAPVALFDGVHFMKLPYVDLLKATEGFSETNLLGVGNFGSVYKGILNDGKTDIAIKVLNLFVRGSSKSFMAECNALKDMRHRNLLKLLSICESMDFQGNDFKALIYEFKANGSLEKWLYHSRERQDEQNSKTIYSLNMMQRLNIAIDIAQALEYLHFGTNSCVVHGDLKPSNILLDQDMTACVGDFGLAKIVSNIVPSDESSNSIGIRGTLGYVAPEYATHNMVSTQGDIYSYGILLLEMFTNKKPTDELFKDHVNLPSFVSSALPDHVMEIVDPRILVEEDMNISRAKDCMVSLLNIGVACSKTTPRDRMSIIDVVKEMSKIRAILLSSSRVELKSGFPRQNDE